MFCIKICIKLLINLNGYEKFLSKISANSGLILVGVQGFSVGILNEFSENSKTILEKYLWLKFDILSKFLNIKNFKSIFWEL